MQHTAAIVDRDTGYPERGDVSPVSTDPYDPERECVMLECEHWMTAASLKQLVMHSYQSQITPASDDAERELGHDIWDDEGFQRVRCPWCRTEVEDLVYLAPMGVFFRSASARASAKALQRELDELHSTYVDLATFRTERYRITPVLPTYSVSEHRAASMLGSGRYQEAADAAQERYADVAERIRKRFRS